MHKENIMKHNLLETLLASNPDSAKYSCIELITCQWVDPKEHVLDSRLCLDIIELSKLDMDDLHFLFETGHLIRELLNFTIVAFKRGKIEPGITTEDLVDGGYWPEYTDSDEAEVLQAFRFDNTSDLIETLREHMKLLSFLNDANSLLDIDHDLALLASSLVYREFIEPDHKVKDSRRIKFFLRSLTRDTDYEVDTKSLDHLMVKFSVDIFKPIDCALTWINLATQRGILVSG